MSGICGLFNFDQAPVAETELRAMTTMLERRGPEGTGAWRDGSLGLGHTLLATTPELVFERQPFKHEETGCVITADVRLDNREELLAAMGLSDQRESIGDAELILMAYLTWGENCLDRLLGDFAFAISDPRHQALFCARDHFGLRPFYYHHNPGQRFLFASDARAILVLPQVPYRINEGRIADFLVRELEWIDYTSTFFDDIYRLPPGHKAIVTAAGLNVTEYWKPAPGPNLGFTSDKDYEQGFLEVFTRAIEARLRVPSNRIGSMLSGGMDSGSVVTVAKDILKANGGEPLRTFSAVRRQNAESTGCAESKAIYAAVSMPSIRPTLIHPDSLEAVFDTLTSGNEEPYDGEFMFMKAIFLAAQEQGVRVVLDGGGGDMVLNQGSYIVRLIRQGNLKLAMAEIIGESRFLDGSPIFSGLIRYTGAAIVPEVFKKPLRALKYSHEVKEYVKASLISRDFASRIDIEERFIRMRNIFRSSRTTDYAVEYCNAIRPNMTAGRERYARIAAATGTEGCDPFMDKRVIEYCSGLPGRFRVKEGWPKMILRQTMAGRMPDEVLWCRRKPHLGGLFNAAVSKQAIGSAGYEIHEIAKTLRCYVDSVALAKAGRTLQEGYNAAHVHSAWLLSMWLRENENRPVVHV